MRPWRMIWVLSALALVACGGKTESSSGAAGGGAGGTSGGGSGGTSFGGTSFGGIGGTGVGGTSVGGTTACAPVDPGMDCGSLSEVACLTAFPRCAPVYDDHCCPSCDPTGACADCIDMRFHHCAAFVDSGCTPGFIPPCGVTPTWACQGGAADCPTQGPCNFVAGCTDAAVAGCAPDQLCPTECHAVTAWTCGPTCNPSPIPYCEKGIPEAGPNGYTGYCVRAGICGAAAGVCPDQAPPSGTTCPSEGLVCQYTGFCAPTCTCQNGVWACLTPPC